jgi:TolB-like protein/Tfp pilus assembly protein PilF
MATGTRPFQADNRAALTAAILTQTPPPVSTLCTAPPLLDRVIARCLEKNPEARWQSARDLASALRWTMEGDGSQAGPPERARTRGTTWWNWKATLAVCVVALLAGAGYLASGLGTVQPAPSPVRIILAVLPFVNNSGDEEQDYLSDGMTDEMIAQLGTLQPSRLGVIARTSAMHYKGTTKRADEIASELGAHYVLEGSIRRAGDKVRIAAQLIDARSQSQVWAEQYDRDMQDVLRVQQEVAKAIARRMAGNLGVDSSAISGSPARHSSNPEAYEHYLRGRYQVSKDTVDGLWKALTHFRTAIDLDPSYALAYSGLGFAYALLGVEGLMPITESHPLARDAALKALQLDDTLSEAHIALAGIIADHYWDWKEAERHYMRALELAPNDADVLRSYSFYLGSMGRADEALPFAERAATLDPVSPLVQMNVGSILCFAGRFDDAVRQLEQSLELDSNFSLAYVMLAYSYLGKGLPDRALMHSEKARALAGTRPLMVAFHANTLALAGRRHEALKALDDLYRLAKPRDPSPYLVAFVYAGLGDKDLAFKWLDKAFEARSAELVVLNVKSNPSFVRIRSDPRFTALLARLNLPR